MIIQMEPTEHIVTVDGVECRIWNAITAKGSQCFVFVHSIAFPNDGTVYADDQTEINKLFNERVRVIIRGEEA